MCLYLSIIVFYSFCLCSFIYLSIYFQYVCSFIYLSICLSIYLSHFHLSLSSIYTTLVGNQSIYLSVYPTCISPSPYLSHLSHPLPIHPTCISPSPSLPNPISKQPIYLPIYLSIPPPPPPLPLFHTTLVGNQSCTVIPFMPPNSIARRSTARGQTRGDRRLRGRAITSGDCNECPT